MDQDIYQLETNVAVGVFTSIANLVDMVNKEIMDQSSTADEAMAILPTTASEQLHQVSFLHISGSFIFILMNIYSS